METRLTIFRPGQPIVGEVVDLAEAPGLSALRQVLRPLLDGGDLEHVSVLYRGEPADMFVDETGAIKRLPVNELATSIYRAATLRREPETDPDSLPSIYGPAVLFDRIVWR